jgi:uncharacterized protein (TIGR03083 family)
MVTSLMSMARDERADLAAFLSTLTPQQWSAPSLCDRWTIKDVVAHVVSYEALSKWGVAKRLIRGGFVNSNQIGVDEFAALTPEELVEFLGNHLVPSGLTAGFSGMIALVDGTVHHQDIRRALAQPRSIPVERLLAVLQRVPSNPRLGAGRRIRGLRLRATDVEWTHGDGHEVTGTGEALLMAMTGRGSVIAELDGPGQPILASRIR